MTGEDPFRRTTTGLAFADGRQSEVVLFAPYDLPAPFWSRANRKSVCHVDLDIAPSRTQRAELHVLAWTGGSGTVKDYFKLTGVHYPVADGERHELIYSRLPVDPKTLERSGNRIELLLDTEHHGIEILYPGPALMLRLRP